ncbi:hypothetical protein [Niveibacterium microcysteis]|uniref:Uncharacterized protein n=1 Tax=Niveibacterium microcysteis TaxID=2811415 RepID=A0ABX7MAC2_9RHOO|nr:hypothetical protein [Niveibacterium microcysteis]QSI78682.1 hypothetical protein JY500_08780 [Niveibacterium microcysteis]
MIKTGTPKHKALTRRGNRHALTRAQIERQGGDTPADRRVHPLLAALLAAVSTRGTTPRAAN